MVGNPNGGINAAALVAACLLFARAAIAEESGLDPSTASTAADASYTVELRVASPPVLAITAELPIDGQSLDMQETRPIGPPELDARGWPGLVKHLHVTAADGRTLALSPFEKSGWRLARPHVGRIKVEYEVDYAALAALGWPAPREAAFADQDHIVFVGRSVFVTTPLVGGSDVHFDVPEPWNVVAPWPQSIDAGSRFAVGNVTDLVDNLVVFSRPTPDVVTAGGFRLLVVPMGHWDSARAEVREVLGAVVPRLVATIGATGRDNYVVVLLPALESGGESFTQSFAYTSDAPPSRANSDAWGNTLAHEVFHHWLGWGLRGSDYAGSQWFQEGFTEYVANTSMVASARITPAEFARKLAEHVARYRELATTLEAGGSRKGPPLYSGGALVAFSWDVRIRKASGGKRNLGDFLQALWKRTGEGRRTYAWRDIEAALNATAAHDWNAFFQSHVRGSEPLPLAESFELAGLRLTRGEDGSEHVGIDAAAPQGARAIWRGIVEGR